METIDPGVKAGLVATSTKVALAKAVDQASVAVVGMPLAPSAGLFSTATAGALGNTVRFTLVVLVMAPATT